jgi:FkbM family methyltransferase
VGGVTEAGWRRDGATMLSKTRSLIKRILATRYTGGRFWRALIYCVLSLRFSKLARRPASKLRLAAVTIATALGEAVSGGQPRARRIVVDLAGEQHQLVVGSCNDLDVLREVLRCDEYPIELAKPPKVIVDLGSHIGASLLAFHARYPDAALVGVEPDPVTFERLRQNTDSLPNVTLANLAMAGHDGSVQFYRARDPWESSTRATAKLLEKIEVPARTLTSLLDELDVGRVDLLKVDIEGEEYEVLRSFDDWSRVGALALEWHGDLNSRSVDQLIHMLPGFACQVYPHGAVAGRHMVLAIGSEANV